MDIIAGALRQIIIAISYQACPSFVQMDFEFQANVSITEMILKDCFISQ